MARPIPKYESKQWETSSLDDHVALIQRQVDRSLADPETVQLARRIVSGKYNVKVDPTTGQKRLVVSAWGYDFPVPRRWDCKPKDAECEIKAIWDFVVANVRYVLDVDQVDTYSDVKTTLEAGAGDCDDFTIVFAALLRAIGFTMRCRIISLDGRYWAHIYPLVELPKGDEPLGAMPLDATEDGKRPGWEFKGYKKFQDYEL